MEREKILEINHMQISFCQYQRGIQQIQLPVIRDLNVTVHAGEMVAVVGSSGSGKSLLAHGIMGILPYNATMEGEVYYCGENLTEKKIKQLRGKEIVLVPQSTSYLDPLMKVGQQICKGKKTPEKKRKLDSIFEKYGLGKNVQEQYPFELSGGMTRRVMISTALIETPKLVIADEPTPGLDPKLARRAMEHFWPGPMTVILQKADQVPDCVTGGLDTVAIRMPDHPVALELIRRSGVPIAAPSANTSGRPSPTKAEHVMEDLHGKIPMILDGGAVMVGVESTIIDFTEIVPVILRPGWITKESMEEFLGCEVLMNTSLKASDHGIPRAPGMKYKHYAPKAEMVLVLGDDQEKVVDHINQLAKEQKEQGKKIGIIASDETKDLYQADEVVSVGQRAHLETVTAHLYDVLREFDHKDVDMIYSEGFEGEPLSEAIMNRMVKAAGHEILRI